MTKPVNAYIVYDLDNWPRNLPSHNFTLKDCLFGVTNIVTNSDKSRYVYSGYGIAFDSANSWSFGNDFARNVVIFGVYNSPSSHIDNLKNNFLVSREGLVMAALVQERKSLVLILLKQRQSFARVYITVVIMVICLLTKKRSISLKQIIKISNFRLNFVYEAHLKIWCC